MSQDRPQDPPQDPGLWARRSGSFGSQAQAYAEHRPDYAPAALAWVLEAVDHPVHQVLDLAAGTGALSGGLVALGLAVTAVEPDPDMLAELHRRLPDVTPVVGAAERIPLADASVDAVLVGTAWHWFHVEQARAEVLRVLRPGGVLGLLWNHDDPAVPWVAELARVAETSASTPPPDPDEHGEPTFDRTGWDGWEVEVASFPHTQRRTPETMTATIGTYSHTVVVSPEERAATLDRIRAFLEAEPATRDGFDRPLLTWTVRLRPARGPA